MNGITWLVSKDNILQNRADVVDQIIEWVTGEVQTSGGFVPQSLGVQGYDNDQRALFDIPEVRSWCQMVHRKKPYLAAMLIEESLDWYLFCLLDLEVINRQKDSIKFRLRAVNQAKQLYDEICREARSFFARICPEKYTQEREYRAALSEAEKRIGTTLAQVIETQAIHCYKCGATDLGQTYEFYYGVNLLGHVPPSARLYNEFKILGQVEASLCNRCSRHHMLLLLIAPFVGFFFVLLSILIASAAGGFTALQTYQQNFYEKKNRAIEQYITANQNEFVKLEKRYIDQYTANCASCPSDNLSNLTRQGKEAAREEIASRFGLLSLPWWGTSDFWILLGAAIYVISAVVYIFGGFIFDWSGFSPFVGIVYGLVLIQALESEAYHVIIVVTLITIGLFAFSFVRSYRSRSHEFNEWARRLVRRRLKKTLAIPEIRVTKYPLIIWTPDEVAQLKKSI